MTNKMKKLTAALLALTLTMGAMVLPKIITRAAEQIPTVKVDGKVVAFPDAQPYVNEDNRTMVPVRFVTEAMGYTVAWEEQKQLVAVSKGSQRVAFRIGENWAIINDSKSDRRVEFDTKAVLKDSRTYVPLRFMAQSLGAGVAWDGVNYQVVINTDGAIAEVPTPTPTPIPPIYEDFELVEGFNPPEGFIQPKFRIVHNTDSTRPKYFSIEFVNFADYIFNRPEKYDMKIECTNYPQLNKIQGLRPDNTLGEITDITWWRNLGWLDDEPQKAPIYMHALSYKGYTTYENAKTFEIYAGMEVEYKITFKKGNYQQVYKKTVKVREKIR